MAAGLGRLGLYFLVYTFFSGIDDKKTEAATFDVRQPSFITEDGHLIIVAGSDRNVTLKTSGRGYVNINGDNIVNLVSLARRASENVERKLTTLADMDRTIRRLTIAIEGPLGLKRRMAHLEAGMADGTTAGGNFRPNRPYVQQRNLRNRVSALEVQVRRLKALLTANECASNPCRNGGTCEDHFNGFVCRCSASWEGTLCETDVNECSHFAGTDLGCQNGATCVNKPGGYECVCPAGWFGIHCTQRSNDCSKASSQDLCGNGVCVSQAGAAGYTCICNQGWTTDSTSKACTRDVDECASNNPPCSRNPLVECVNVPGSFFCARCPAGFSGSGYYCTDINECLENNGGCSQLVQCINTYGSRVCSSCPPGYMGNGETCTYAGGACRTNNGGCHPLATCQDNAAVSSSFVICTCPPGYSGSGVGPAGCYPNGESPTTANPCASNPCVRGNCVRIATSYVCRCLPGFTGTVCNVPLDPCSSNPCKNGGTCMRRTGLGEGSTRLPDTYTCKCTAGFSGITCANQIQACGGTRNEESGTIQFPTSTGTYQHSQSCAWVIIVNTTMVVNATFKSFSLEPSTSSECLFDWLQIHDGRSAGEQIIGRFCGDTLPKNGNIISTHNTLYLWFRSDKSSNHAGFVMEWNAISPVCGGAISTVSHGRLESPGSPGKYPPNRDCLWTIIGPMGKRLQFHFYTLMIASSANCSQDWLEIHDGMLTSDPVIVKFCNTSHPPPITIPGPVALVHFHSDATGSDNGFQLTYTVTEGFPGCGGVLTAPSGDIISPKDPDKKGYQKSLNCDWKIQVGINERISLSFDSFNLETSTNCNFDYLEVREGGDENAPLIGRYCGTTSPRTFTSLGSTLWIRFRSDASLSGEGFRIKYKILCGGVYEASQGIIQSPLYPNPYPNSRLCEYVIKQPMGKAIKLHFNDFDVEDISYPKCIFDYLEIRDGDNENSTLVGRYCGRTESLIPPDVVSTLNYLWLQFGTDASNQNKGFQANFTTIDVGCGGILKESMGVLTSPSNGDEYPHNIVCTWVIVAQPGFVVQFQFVSMSLEAGPDCNRDYVEIFDNSSISNGGSSLGRFCTGIPPAVTSTDTTMTVKFVTDISIAREGFTARYFTFDASKMCGAHFFNAAGAIQSPNYPEGYPEDKDCKWVITAPLGQQIMLNISDFVLEHHQDCRFDYLEIRNGAHDTSPLIGKFCGEEIPRRIPSMTNQMYLRFVTDGSRNKKGFRLTWDSTSTGCGGTLTAPTGSIMSPNYPQPYGRNAECFWKIVVNQGSKIQVVFNDLDLEQHSACNMDYIEMYDGLDSRTPKIGRYCDSHPAFVMSTSNHMFIKFKSDLSREGRGFHIKYDAVCTTKLTGYHGVIESPNFPNTYPAGRDCTWTIEALTGNKVNLTFSHFEMENDTSDYYDDDDEGPNAQRTSVASTCKFDYLEISEGTLKSPATTVLGRFCGITLPPTIHSTKEDVYVHFVSDASVGSNGFRLEWVINGCGGHLTHPRGEFMSPGYPGAYPDSVACEWLIVLEPDQSVQLNITDIALERSRSECGYDGLKVYGGPDKTSPLLGTYCHNEQNISLTSSSNYMLVWFFSDFSYSGRGFKARYRPVPSLCGGKFMASTGVIHSRNYPKNYDPNDDCFWLIEVDQNHVVRLTFTSFDIEAHHNCSMDYVRVFDGDSETAPKLIDHCGNTLPAPSEVTSTTNKLLVRFKSDGSIAAKGFMANYSLACGARIVTEDSGLLQARDSISVYSNIEYSPNCSWIIVGAKQEDRVTLTITHLDVSPGDEEDESCEYYQVDIHDGDDVNSPLIGSYCGNKAPPHLTSRGNSMVVHLVSKNGYHYGKFAASYSVLSGACGGELTSEHGSFASLNYPDNYPPNSECIWIISASPGNRAMISFVTFDLEQSDFCDGDYVEVREVDSLGPLVGVYCSTSLPGNVTASNKLWVKFKSNGVGNGKGFLADYSLLHGNEIKGLRGQIASPLYPREYIQTGTFYWRITVEFGYAVGITFKNFYMDQYGSRCTAYLAIYDGYDTTTPELVKLCGRNQLPDPFTSTTNVVYIELITDPMKEGTRFLLEWMQVDKANTNNPFSPAVNASGCDAMINLMQRNTTEPYRLTSPGFPYGYADKMTCEWTFLTSPGSRIGLTFRTMDLEESSQCSMDYVTIYQGEKNAPSWKKVKTLCLRNATAESVRTETSLMKVQFRTDSLKNESGFEAIVYPGCGGQLTDTNGVIEITNKTVPIDPYYETTVLRCQWNITVRTGRKIAVTFSRFELSPTTEVGCTSNVFLMLKNGHGDDSPILGNGKYCGNSLPVIPDTVGNKLFVKLVALRGNRGFRMQFQEVAQSCGGNIKLEATVPGVTPSVVIMSPNYPNIPPPHIECTWVIMAPAGERLHIDFLERFDLTASPGCSQAAVELRDGGTQLSQPIGQPFCFYAPNSQYTTGNYLYVRFFTDVNDPKNGFKANVSVATCGGTVRDSIGTIRYPGPREYYQSGVDCEWRIVGSKGTFLTLQFQLLDLSRQGSNCTAADYVTISEIVPGNDTGFYRSVLGTYCRMGSTNETILTSANEVLISFHSSQKARQATESGFKIIFNSSREICGGALNTPNGVFQSPGYGSNEVFSNRFCVWQITVPAGRRITAKFLDFDLEPMAVAYGQRLVFFNHHAYKSRIVMYNSTSIVRPVKSSGNKMLVHFWARHNVGHRGFKISYSSDEPTICSGDFNQSTGVIVSPQTENSSFAFYCEWEHVRRGNLNETLSVTLVNGSIGNRDVLCERSQSVVSVTSQQGKIRIGDLCGNFTSPYTIRSPYPVTKLETMSSLWNGRVTFALSYKTSQCGGLLSGPEDVVTSPGFPSNYPSDTDCAWAVEYPPDQVIKVHFVTMDLESMCDKDYVIIYNGPSPKSPMIGKFCGNVVPGDIKTQSNKMWIDFHSDSSGQKSGFKLTLEPVMFGCGGIFHGKNGELFSPEFPSQYPNNAECEWELRISDGYRIQLQFVDRFNLETSKDCENDFLEISESSATDGDWKKIGRFCGRNAPDIQNSTGARMKILFRSNGDTRGDGFKVRWSVICGGLIQAESQGRIVSPGYPDAYAGNLRCNYTIVAPGRHIMTKFTTFSLEGGYSTDCRYDNLTIYGLMHYWSRESQTLGIYCGSNTPPDRVVKDKLTVDFRSDAYVEKKGFVMEYSVSGCGGNITSPTSIEAGKVELFGTINCTWVIKAPPYKVIIIRFSAIDLNYNYQCRFEAVSVYEGSTINKTATLGNYCGNLTNNPPVVRTSTNRAVVMLLLRHQREDIKMSANIIFAAAESAGCGGAVNVNPLGTILGYPSGKQSNYEPFSDCHWLLTAPEGHTISMALQELSVAPCFNRTFNATIGCTCDYLEVHEGKNQFADLIGRYCGEKPKNPILSSSNQLWVRFASDGVNEAPGFIARLTSTLSVCGLPVLNVTNTTQELVSPGWPNNYPSNLRCRWQLSTERNSRIAIHFEEIKLDDSSNCDDQLTLMDTGMPVFVEEGTGGSDVTYGGRPSYPVSIHRGSRNPTTAVHFCGSPKHMDYYSESNNVAVTFNTNHEGAAKGFKMRYTVTGCTRNYTAIQGRIVVEKLPERCYIVVSAAANHTISLYFSNFMMMSSTECNTRALEVRDGDNADAPLITKLCGYENPSPIFSTGNKIYLHTWRHEMQSYEHFDITYTTTDKGRGCGGQLFNYGGIFTSPFFPNNVRNVSVCRWDVSVPTGLRPVLQFTEFDLGPKSTCNTDYVELIDIDTTTTVEMVRSRYCGGDVPTIYVSESNSVAVRYTRSQHNGGTGWVIRFMGNAPGAPIPQYRL